MVPLPNVVVAHFQLSLFTFDQLCDALKIAALWSQSTHGCIEALTFRANEKTWRRFIEDCRLERGATLEECIFVDHKLLGEVVDIDPSHPDGALTLVVLQNNIVCLEVAL